MFLIFFSPPRLYQSTLRVAGVDTKSSEGRTHTVLQESIRQARYLDDFLATNIKDILESFLQKGEYPGTGISLVVTEEFGFISWSAKITGELDEFQEKTIYIREALQLP